MSSINDQGMTLDEFSSSQRIKQLNDIDRVKISVLFSNDRVLH